MFNFFCLFIKSNFQLHLEALTYIICETFYAVRIHHIIIFYKHVAKNYLLQLLVEFGTYFVCVCFFFKSGLCPPHKTGLSVYKSSSFYFSNCEQTCKESVSRTIGGILYRKIEVIVIKLCHHLFCITVLFSCFIVYN